MANQWGKLLPLTSLPCRRVLKAAMHQQKVRDYSLILGPCVRLQEPLDGTLNEKLVLFDLAVTDLDPLDDH